MILVQQHLHVFTYSFEVSIACAAIQVAHLIDVHVALLD